MICNAMRRLREVSRSHVAKPKELPGNAFGSIKGLLSGTLYGLAMYKFDVLFLF